MSALTLWRDIRGVFDFPSEQPAEQALLCHAARWSPQQARGSMHRSTGQTGHSGMIAMTDSTDTEQMDGEWEQNARREAESEEKQCGNIRTA